MAASLTEAFAGFQLCLRVVGKRLGVAVQVGQLVRFLVDAGLGLVILLPDNDGHETEQHGVQHADHDMDAAGDFVA